MVKNESSQAVRLFGGTGKEYERSGLNKNNYKLFLFEI